MAHLAGLQTFAARHFLRYWASPMTEFSIQSQPLANGMLLSLQGRMDAENAAEFDNVYARLLAQGTTCFIIDLEALKYVSSMGLRSFLALAKTLEKQRGVLRLCQMHGLVRQVFDMTGLASLFSVFESVADATKGI